jgi:bifunctional DNase/RNase
MVKTELSRIIIDEKKHEQVIVLKEISGTRLLPIVVGLNEAVAIRMYLNADNPPRPLIHDLTKKIIEALGAVLDKVIIDKLVDNTFHAKLHLKICDGKVIVVDARPSDSVALAVRFNLPVFVEEAVFEKLARSV